MEALRPVGGEGGANAGRSSVCVHYRGPEGHRGGIMTAAVRAPVPSSAAPHVGTAGAREALGPAAPSCPVTSGLWRGSCLPAFPPPQALPLPRAPVTADRTPQGFPEPVAPLGTTGNTCLSPGSSAAPGWGPCPISSSARSFWAVSGSPMAGPATCSRGASSAEGSGQTLKQLSPQVGHSMVRSEDVGR